MADFRLGRLKFKWRGDWAASTAYVIDDIVKYGANAYVCTTNHTSSAAETSFYSTDLGNWDLHTEGLRTRGDYQTTGVWYALNDIVKYGNTVYRCTTPHTGPAVFDFTKWAVYSEGLNFESSWDSATVYQKGDIVTFGGYTYIAQQNSTNVAPNTDQTYWKVLSTGFSPQGDYNSAEVYEPGNLVKYGGNSYSCKVTTSTENYAIDTISADGTTGTLTFTVAQPAAPFGIGDQVTITGSVVAAFNATFRVLTCSTTGFTFATTQNAGASGGNVAYIPVPSNTRFWDLVIEGLNFTGAWANTSVYQLGDVVNRNGNSYVCITLNTTGAATAPELDTNADYWNYLSQGGDAAQVLQETGDLLYQSASGINRIALPANVATATADELKEASGKVLAVGGSPILPRWETNNVTNQVYYVAKEGSDSNNGRSISRAFATLRFACDYIGGLAGAEAPSITNPITIYIKAGVYEETLPIFIPSHVSIVGDNLRNSIIKPKSGFNSTTQTLVLATDLGQFQYGDIVSNRTGSKTAEIIEYISTTRTLTIQQSSGGSWTSADSWTNTISHQSADAARMLLANKNFLAQEAYYRYAVDNLNPPDGVAADVIAALEEYVEDLAHNVRAGGNDKVHATVDALIATTETITGDNSQDKQLLQTIGTAGQKVINNEAVTAAGGNGATQYIDSSITVDAGGCATQKAVIGTLTTLAVDSLDLGSMQSGINYDAYLSITTAQGIVNQESTMFFLGSHTTLKDMVWEGMSGFLPYATDDKDVDHATLKGVYLRLDANSPITKSPYIQNCAAIGGAAVGVVLDGGVHERYDNTSTRSNKSMVFDSYTQILDDGVGFYVTRGAASEIVSCFTYYCHISYTSTRGGRIRAVSGNSSYGKYGCISRGFDANEVTIDGKVKGLRLEIAPGTLSGGFTIGERIIGGTSGAVGELISDQTPSNFIYYFPVKGTFTQGETVTGQLSSATVDLVNNTDAVTGQKGFVLTVVDLAAGPDQGGSVELQDNGVNNDPGSYVISSSSYIAPDGRGSLTVTRAGLGSTAAPHDGTTGIAHYKENVNGNTTFLTGAINSTSTGTEAAPYIMGVDSVAGMVANGYVVVGSELFKIVSIAGAQQIEVARAQDGTIAQNHSQNDTVTIFQPKVEANDASADELIEDTDAIQTDLRVAKANIAFEANDYIKIDNEFFLITAVTPDTTGITTLLFSDQKVIDAGDGQDFKIRYRYSQVRLTAHDFLDVGTGNKANTNWPGLPLSPNVPSQETDEARPGRVYYVSTDQDGNFAVGKYFRVEQATGKATLDASAFDLSGLESLRLGSIGAQLGASINEFSTDGTMAQNSNEKVPTQAAVVTYVSNLSGVDSDFSIGGNLTVRGTTTTVSSVTVTSKDRNIELGSVSSGTFTGDIEAGSTDITNVSDTTNLAPGVQVSLTGGGGTVTMSGTYTVASLSGTTVTLNAVFQGSGSATGASFSAGGSTITTADGGGITLKADTDRTITWQASNEAWKLSEHADLATGKEFMIDGTTVLSANAVLGKTIATDFSAIDDTAIPTVEAVEERINAQVSSTSYFLSLI